MIDITRLRSNIDSYVTIDEIISVPEEYLSSTDIKAIGPVLVKGSITKDSLEEYVLSLTIDGEMKLPCSITLEPVTIPFHVDLDDNLEALLGEIGETSKKVTNTIDLLPIIWENILMEVPMKVTSKEAEGKLLEGDGWKMITEEEQASEGNPELEKLKDLL